MYRDAWDDLIEATHAEIDRYRKRRKLKPWNWGNKRMGQRPLENITFEGKPLKVYFEEAQRSEIEKVHRREMAEKSVGLHNTGATAKFGNTSGQRSQYANRTRQLSPEVIQHLNYLQRAKGEQAVTDYLNSNTRADGSIESAVRDAEQKVKHYTSALVQAQQEVTRWEAIYEQLKKALALVSGRGAAVEDGAKKIGRPKGSVNKGPKKMSPSAFPPMRGQWPAAFQRVLLTNLVTRKALFTAMGHLGTKGAIYQALQTGLKRGYLVENELGIRYNYSQGNAEATTGADAPGAD